MGSKKNGAGTIRGLRSGLAEEKFVLEGSHLLSENQTRRITACIDLGHCEDTINGAGERLLKSSQILPHNNGA